MSTTFSALWNQLTAEVPGLSGPAAREYVRQAWLEIQREYEWSFLHEEGVLIVPNQISSGTFETTRYSQYVIPDITAGNALINLSNPVITKRQIRFGSQASGPVYNIIESDLDRFPSIYSINSNLIILNVPLDSSWVGKRVLIANPSNPSQVWTAVISAVSGVNITTANNSPFNVPGTPPLGANITTAVEYRNGITLDRVYQNPSASGTAYRVYRCYYEPCDLLGNPVTDFKRWAGAYDPRLGYPIRTWAPTSNVDLMMIDVQRAATGNPMRLVPYKTISVNGEEVMQYELWPHPTAATVINTLYLRRGETLTHDSDTVPQVIPRRLVIQKALLDAYKWAEANKSTEDELRRSAWLALLGYVSGPNRPEGSYQTLLNKTILDDEDQFMSSWIISKWRNWMDVGPNAAYLQKTEFSYYNAG